MGLFATIKSMLGIGTSAPQREGEPRVEVEREPDSEAKEVEESGSEADEVEEPVAEPTDATGSTESIVDEEAAAADPAEAAESAEAAGPTADDMDTDIEEPEPGSDEHDIEESDPESAESASDGHDVQEIKGIGPAYGERLAEVDVVTVADLAAADPDELAERTSVPEGRLREWVERAQEFEG